MFTQEGADAWGMVHGVNRAAGGSCPGDRVPARQIGSPGGLGGCFKRGMLTPDGDCAPQRGCVPPGMTWSQCSCSDHTTCQVCPHVAAYTSSTLSGGPGPIVSQSHGGLLKRRWPGPPQSFSIVGSGEGPRVCTALSSQAMLVLLVWGPTVRTSTQALGALEGLLLPVHGPNVQPWFHAGRAECLLAALPAPNLLCLPPEA